MLVRAMLAPESADDSELRKCRRPAKHALEALVLIRRKSMLRDELRRDLWIARAGKHFSHCNARSRSNARKQRLEESAPVVRTEKFVERSFRMRHHSKNVSGRADNSRNCIRRTVRIRRIGH